MNFDNKAVSISLVILATISVFYVMVVGKAFLVPLAVAVMIWYVINALSRTFAKIIPWVEKKNWLTTLVSLVSIGMFITFAIDMVQRNITDVSAAAPAYKANFDILANKLVTQFGLESVPNLQELIDGIEVAPLISKLASSFTSMISNIFLVLIYVLFLMLEQGTFTKKITAIFPNKEKRSSILSILSHAQEDIQTYLWIKTLTSSVTGVVSYLVLLAVGVDFAGFWAFTIFLLNFIPTVGSIIATLFPALLALIQFDTFLQFFIVLVGVGAIQVMVGNFLEPKLMGNSLNLSPFIVIISLTLWGSVWGIAGMFLSVPITVMLLIIFAHFKGTRYLAILLSGDGSLKFADDFHES
ncbi:MAG: AI-2E family transporter [Acidiferrobacterales bacterium]|nr:AI-2E family transporter [Acidiferrobacterales bacterium]